ncbi:polysaccharide biosynthesis/export family protein [Thermopirellula anaerolimosa]
MERKASRGSTLPAWFAAGAIMWTSLSAVYADERGPFTASPAAAQVYGSARFRVEPLPPPSDEMIQDGPAREPVGTVGVVRPGWLPVGPTEVSSQPGRIELAADEADRITRDAYDLAGRGALFAAREQFLTALRILAEALDAEFPERRHAASLNAAWIALREAEDFLPRSATAAPPDTASVAAGHATPILKDADLRGVTGLEAYRRYLSFAQDQFALAADSEFTASMALRGLGKVYGAFAERGVSQPREASAVAVMFYQAALSARPDNYMAANDLGVLLAKGGRWNDARQVLEYAVSLSPGPSTCWNLIRVCSALGDPAGVERARQILLAAHRGETADDDRRPEIRWVSPESWIDGRPGRDDVSASPGSASVFAAESQWSLGGTQPSASGRTSAAQGRAESTSRDNPGDRFLEWLGLKRRTHRSSEQLWIISRPAESPNPSDSRTRDSQAAAGLSGDETVRRTAWWDSRDAGDPSQGVRSPLGGAQSQTVDPVTGLAPGASPAPPPSSCSGYRCGVQCPDCGGLRRGGWDRARIIAWERYAQGEYVGPARAAHVNEYRLRVDDELQIVYRLTREETSRPYRLNVGDEIRVESAVDPKIERTVIVQPDGTVTLLFLGQVKATGHTVDQLRLKLDQLYSKYYRNPSITVTPVVVNSKLEDLRASVDRRAGEGGQSQNVRVTPEGTISLPLLATVPAQGLTLRELEMELNARYREQLEGMEVTPILTQRAPRYVYVLGEVASPGRFELTGPTTVLQAVSMAGGWNKGANLRQVVVFRRGEDWRLSAAMLNLESTLHGHNACPADEIWLSDSDVIILPKNFFQRADDFIEMVFTKGIYGVFPMQATINFAKLSTI